MVTVWDAETCKDVAKFDHQMDHSFRGLEIEWQNSKRVAMAGMSKKIYLWDTDAPERPSQVWSGHEEIVDQITWDSTGSMLASCSKDSFYCIWKPEKSTPVQKTPVQTFDKERTYINTIRWNCNPKMGHSQDPLLASGCQDGFIMLWNVNQGKLVQALNAHDQEGGVRCLAFSPTNNMLASGGLDNLVLWSL